jgi:hypothetical protein
MKTTFALTMATTLLCMVGVPSFAGWTVVDLNPGGATADFSIAYGVSDGQQVGATGLYTASCAGVWSGTAQSWVNLGPAGAAYSVAEGISRGQQAGYARINDTDHAGMWSGTAASWVDLHPAGASGGSRACAIGSGQQVGYAYVAIPGGSTHHASLWSGTAASWIDLQPAGYSDSYAYGVGDRQQVGQIWTGWQRHASLWHGTAASVVDLNPAGVTQSSAVGIAGGQQVGYAYFGDNSHAALWSGTAGSFVDLNPTGALLSSAYGVSHGKQAGYACFGGGPFYICHAGLWSGTTASWVDLHAFLPSQYATSAAVGIDVVGEQIWVVGNAYNSTTRNDEAMLWHYTPDPVPEPSSLIVLGALVTPLLAFRRRRV